MSDLVQINNNKENILEFELSAEGIDPKNVNAKFVIRSAEMDLAFVCENTEGNKWRVKLPPLSMLDRTTYPFHFQVVAEGYHFEPLKGAVNVVGSNDVYITQPKSKLSAPVGDKPAPVVEKEKPAAVKPSPAQPTRGREKSIAQIAQELMEGNKPKKEEVKAPPLAKPVLEEAAPVVEAKAPEPLLPRIDVNKKEESKTSEKDAKVRAILEEAGHKTKPAKAKFSILKDSTKKH